MPTRTPPSPTADLEAWFAAHHADLRAMARARMAHERAGHTHVATSLVSEAYLRLRNSAPPELDRASFLSLTATAMARILIDSARRRRSRPRDTEPMLDPSHDERDRVLEGLDGALDRLARHDPFLHRVVEARFLIGLDVPRAAAELGVSTATVKRGWRTARAFLAAEIRRDDDA